MNTTFSYFPGMLKNPAPPKYYFKKQNQNNYEYELYTNASKNKYSIYSYTNSVLF